MADPILHNIVIKDIFAGVYLVNTEQITNRVSLGIIGIGCNSSEMDRDRYSGNVEADNGGGEEEEEEQKNILCGGGTSHGFLYEIPALLSLACMLREVIKTNENETYMTQKIKIRDVGIPDPPPPPPSSKKSLKCLIPPTPSPFTGMS